MMEKEERWSTRGKVNGQTPRDLCDQLFTALADSCEIPFLDLVDANFLSEKDVEEAKNLIYNEVDTGVVNFRYVQGAMERKMYSGSFSFRVFNTLMRKHNVFENNDLVIIDRKEYFVKVNSTGKPILEGKGRKNGYSLRRLLSDGTVYSRGVNNPDMDWMGFINGLKDPVRDLFPN